MAEVGIDVDDHDFVRCEQPLHVLAEDLRLVRGSSSAPRRRPTEAVIDMSQPNRSRSAPRTCAAISTTPSSVTLPLGSSETRRHVPEGLDRPLPVAAAADVGADQHGLGIAPGQLGEAGRRRRCGAAPGTK